jgi:site-specific DNA-methyltransferase (adenine-specific)
MFRPPLGGSIHVHLFIVRMRLYGLLWMRQIVAVTDFDLRNEDCVAGLRRLADESVELVVTSPPYNLGIAYRKYRDRKHRDDYLAWCEQWAAALRRVLNNDGSVFLNLGGAPSNPLLPHELVWRLRNSFVLQNTIHWIKSIALPNADHGITSRGHFKPISSRRYLNDCHEYIFHLTKKGRVEIDRLALGVPYQDKSNISRWSHTLGRDRRCRGNTWFIPYATIKSRQKQRPHPATFPVELAENCIRLHGASRVKTMLDPFLGIGNSALAAQRCRVPKFIGFDIDETYVAEATARVGNCSRDA